MKDASGAVLPGVTVEAITEFLRLSGEMKSPAWARHVREWAQTNRPAGR